MDRYDWSRLTHMQVGRYAEYFVKMEFTLYGFDVYTSEVDDHGIDFVVRKGVDTYYDVQVKSVRAVSYRSSYIFFPKDKFDPRANLLAAVVIFRDGQEPELYLIPSTVWYSPNALFVERNYEGLKSKPEWGLTLSQRNIQLLAEYTFSATIQRL